VTRLFAQPKGGFIAGPVGYGDSMIVMEVTDITPPTPDPTSEEFKKMQQTLNDAIKTDILMTMVAGYEQELGTNINGELMQKLRSDAQQ
jgi:hypothetical protein